MSTAFENVRSTPRQWWRGLSVEQKVAVLFTINAFINWTTAVRGIIDPVGMASTFRFDHPPEEYTFVVRLWASFVFMFGCMFWEVSRDVRRKAALVKYNWIEKTLTAGAVTFGFLVGEAPIRLMMLILLTNWAWIPPLLYLDRRLQRSIQSEGR